MLRYRREKMKEDEVYVNRSNILKISGESFTCQCGCNVFSKLVISDDGIQRYECNSCNEIYKTT